MSAKQISDDAAFLVEAALFKSGYTDNQILAARFFSDVAGCENMKVFAVAFLDDENGIATGHVKIDEKGFGEFID